MTFISGFPHWNLQGNPNLKTGTLFIKHPQKNRRDLRKENIGSLLTFLFFNQNAHRMSDKANNNHPVIDAVRVPPSA